MLSAVLMQEVPNGLSARACGDDRADGRGPTRGQQGQARAGDGAPSSWAADRWARRDRRAEAARRRARSWLRTSRACGGGWPRRWARILVDRPGVGRTRSSTPGRSGVRDLRRRGRARNDAGERARQAPRGARVLVAACAWRTTWSRPCSGWRRRSTCSSRSLTCRTNSPESFDRSRRGRSRRVAGDHRPGGARRRAGGVRRARRPGAATARLWSNRGDDRRCSAVDRRSADLIALCAAQGRMQMKLYNSIGPNPRVVRMFMAERGIDIPKQDIDLRGGENRREPYPSKSIPRPRCRRWRWTMARCCPKSRRFANIWTRTTPGVSLIGSNAPRARGDAHVDAPHRPQHR